MCMSGGNSQQQQQQTAPPPAPPTLPATQYVIGAAGAQNGSTNIQGDAPQVGQRRRRENQARFGKSTGPVTRRDNSNTGANMSSGGSGIKM